jgi:hypothetical protein
MMPPEIRSYKLTDKNVSMYDPVMIIGIKHLTFVEDTEIIIKDKQYINHVFKIDDELCDPDNIVVFVVRTDLGLVIITDGERYATPENQLQHDGTCFCEAILNQDRGITKKSVARAIAEFNK